MFETSRSFALLLLLSSPAWAQVPIETFVVTNPPAPDQIARWSALPGTRDYLFKLGDPGNDDLRALSGLRGARKITVEVNQYPTEDTIQEFHTLANQGIEFVVTDGMLPNDNDISILNRIGFSKCNILVSGYYPDAADSLRMKQLTCELTVEFVGNAYPRYDQKAGIAALAVKTPLIFAIDMWPFYTHMDVFNMLPQQIHVWGRGMFPPAEEVQYLQNIHHLAEITVETSFEPESPDVWKVFGDTMTRWQADDHVPTADELGAFQRGGANRELILKTDSNIVTDDDLAVMRNSPLPIRWIHDAP